MRWLRAPLYLCLALVAGPVMAGPEAPTQVALTEKMAQACLSDAELREEIAAQKAIAQAEALRVARATVAAEPVRARLCRRDGTLVYVITALAKDGKVTRIKLDAGTGRVLGQR